MIRGLISRLINVDVVEAYSPPRVTKEARKYGLKPGEAWDLTEGWDFILKQHQQAALKYQEINKPLLLIGSPRARRSTNSKPSTQEQRSQEEDEQRA